MTEENAKSKAAIDKIPDADFEAIFAFIETHTLAEAQAWLIKEYGAWLPNGSLSTRAISEWASAHRDEKRKAASIKRLLEVRSAKQNAEEIMADLGSRLKLDQANAAMASAALIDAQLSGNPDLVKVFAEIFQVVGNTVAKTEGNEVKRGTLETIREKFKVDLTKKLDLGLQEVYSLLEKTEEGKAIVKSIQRIAAEAVEAV